MACSASCGPRSSRYCATGTKCCREVFRAGPGTITTSLNFLVAPQLHTAGCHAMVTIARLRLREFCGWRVWVQNKIVPFVVACALLASGGIACAQGANEPAKKSAAQISAKPEAGKTAAKPA